MLPNAEDKDPKYTSKCVKQWFTENNIRILEWSIQSWPVINRIREPIELRCGFITTQKNKDYNELWQTIKETWYEIRLAICYSLPNAVI